MTIRADDTLRAAYYLSGDQQDWLAGVSQQPDGSVAIVYRFRYYDGNQRKDPFDSGDTKSWYELKKTGPASLNDALDACQEVYDVLLATGYVPHGGIACKLIRGSMTHEQFMDEFMKLPFVHTRHLN
jgi:hypothetical protein